MEYIHVVVSTDQKFLKYTGVMLTSLLENFNSQKGIKKLSIHAIISSDVAKHDLELLKELCASYDATIEFLEIKDMKMNQFVVSGHISLATYFRIFISELLSKDIQKVIYLDSDLIIKGNISELWDIDLSEKIVAAVDDPMGMERMADLKIPSNYSYFNAGVLVINLANWRKRQLTEQILSFIKDNPSKLIYWDQDALNATLYDQRMSIHPKWNVQTAMYDNDYSNLFNDSDYIYTLENPMIIHYTSASKPWHITNNHPLKKEFHYYFQKSPWKDTELTSNTFNHLLREKLKIFVFGTGSLAKRFIENMSIDVEGFFDNDPKKWGQQFCEKEIYSPDLIRTLKKEQIGIIIVSSFYQEISQQLVSYGLKENEDFVWQL